MPANTIVVRGARQHNLKEIDLDIPRDKLVVITGLSGSGKSTLAFDTLYAEGQRRYVESLSVYARQFLERMDKPDVDFIDGLSPAIAIEQKSTTQNPRSTVGTVTEIHDYLRILFARVGVPHCHRCGRPITTQTVEQIVDRIMQLESGTKIVILSPLVTQKKGSHNKLFRKLRRDGFARVEVDGQTVDLAQEISLGKNRPHTIAVVVDRLVVKDAMEKRLADSLELAMALSEGLVTVGVIDGERLVFSERAACVNCGTNYPKPTPASFSFNNPQGACPACSGLGSRLVFDPDTVVPDPDLTLREGAIAPWENRHSVYFFQVLDSITRQFQVNIHTPFKGFPEALQNLLLYGSQGEPISFYLERDGRRHTYSRPFEGVIPSLERRYQESSSSRVRDDIERFMSVQPCPECHGGRLKAESLAITVAGRSIHDMSTLSIDALRRFFSSVDLSVQDAAVSKRILREIDERLFFLDHVGVGYLSLDRASSTLSAGEWQRIRLARQISTKLTGVLYVLDEPSIGLHQRDNQKLLETLKQMRDLGNTVIVVEHDAETILSADHIIDIGPKAGVHGGELIFSGSPQALVDCPDSLTGQYLSGRKTIPLPDKRRRSRHYLTLEGARANNLKDITVRFPLGSFVCVTGVSGSGKSTLIIDTLHRALGRYFHRAKKPVGTFDRITGLEHIDGVVHIDQSPIGRTPRSNPATYSGLFAEIRRLFAKTPDARQRGYKPGRFSFNVKGGRCEACRGDGTIKIEMHFLPDVHVTCDICKGKRYNRETLEVKYKGKNISEVLDLTINQALQFFHNVKNVRDKLQTLADVGLDYLHLGQGATILSGGEAQRLKLSKELSKKGTGKTIYILDEPTTGLHFADIRKLLDVLKRLIDAGNTVIVIEHNLDVIKLADHVIDLGPEGGNAGGQVVGCGTPEEVAQMPGSHTGKFLGSSLGPIEKKAAPSKRSNRAG